MKPRYRPADQPTNMGNAHVVNVNTSGAYGTGTKVQPDAITCVVWMRTA